MNHFHRPRYYKQKGFQEFSQGSMLRFMDNKPHWGKTDPIAMAERYLGWTQVLAGKNATAISSGNLRLYAARGQGQGKARHGKPVDQKTLEYLGGIKSIASNPVFANAAEVEEITDHTFLRLMDSPNDIMDGTFGWMLTSIFMDLTGNAYWHVERDGLGVPVGIYPLLSQFVQVVPDEKSFIKGYLYGVDPTNRVAFSREEIVHFKFPNPNDLFVGAGRLQAFVRSHDLADSIADYEKSITDNRARPDAMVQYKAGSLSKEKRRELEREWNQKFKGASKAGRILISDYEYELKEIGFTPAMVAALETRKWTRNELCAAFGVPIPMVDTEKVPRANYDTALYDYMRGTIAPVFRLLEHRLNKDLVYKYDERLFACFDNPIPEDQAALKKQENEDLDRGVVIINEVREKRGLNPVGWGVEPLVRAGTVPLSASIKKHTTPTAGVLRASRIPAEGDGDEGDKDDEKKKGSKRGSSSKTTDQTAGNGSGIVIPTWETYYH